MAATPEEYIQRIDRLKADMSEQGRRVATMLDHAIEAVFNRDETGCKKVVEADAVIDRVDVEVERAAVKLLGEIAREEAALEDDRLRMILTIVKVNNELERIADAAVDIAQMLDSLGCIKGDLPRTFRVMANSVIGLLGNTVRCFDTLDTDLARTVLASDEAVEEFERVILRDAQTSLSLGALDVDAAFALHTMASRLEIINAHSCNIAEQVIYVATGAIVRHQGGHWSDPTVPE